MSKKSVLLVDDDWDSINVMSQILWNEGYSIDVARHGLEALDRVKAQKHNVAILDYIMPYYQGDELAKLIKGIDPDIHVILVTGYKIILHPTSKKLFDYILEKPLDISALFDALREITEKPDINPITVIEEFK
jgi:CheY-like chemotaxis protein